MALPLEAGRALQQSVELSVEERPAYYVQSDARSRHRARGGSPSLRVDRGTETGAWTSLKVEGDSGSRDRVREDSPALYPGDQQRLLEGAGCSPCLWGRGPAAGPRGGRGVRLGVPHGGRAEGAWGDVGQGAREAPRGTLSGEPEHARHSRGEDAGRWKGLGGPRGPWLRKRIFTRPSLDAHNPRLSSFPSLQEGE